MHIYKRLFFGLAISFIFATIIGTLTHEFGHYIVAKSFGYEATINYKSTFWIDTKNTNYLDSTYAKYETEINENKKIPELETYYQICNTNYKNSFWITLGGPIETIITGTIGFLILFYFRKTFYSKTKLVFIQWLLIFISLFWLRQIAIFVTWAAAYIITGGYSTQMDEIKLAAHLNLPYWSIITTTAIIGIVVLLIVIFKFVPIKQRITFIISGIVGGISGFLVWFLFLGKIILP